ncbi:MAG: OsmC family protein [Saprospiraceae bacterium]
MTSEIIYNGELRTTATHLQSGERIISDAPCDNQGKGQAFSPTDLVATALGSCMMTIMGIKARDNGLDIVGAKCSINKIMASEPRRIGKVEVTFTMPANNFSEADKNLLTEAAKGCPVCRSLSGEVEVDLSFVW